LNIKFELSALIVTVINWQYVGYFYVYIYLSSSGLSLLRDNLINNLIYFSMALAFLVMIPVFLDYL